MRARTADREGFAEHDGVKIHYEVYGDGDVTFLLMPTWTIIHKRFWKVQIPYLARHHRVVVYDGPGNGRSDRPLEPAAYGQDAQAAYARAVLDATNTERAVLVALSKGANWALDLAANHAGRVLGTVLLGPSVAVSPTPATRAKHVVFDGPAPAIEPSRVPGGGTDPDEHWAKYNPDYWQREFEDFRWFFFGQCFPEPHSTKQIEDAVRWSGDTTPSVLIADSQAAWPNAETLAGWCARISAPVLLIHGDDDRISPLKRSQILAKLTGGWLVTVEGGGHIANARDPVAVSDAVAGALGGPATVTVVCVDVPGCEHGAILATAEGGTVIFFSMATSFPAAALGAEGLAADVTMLVGNGYAPGHADYALDLVRRTPAVREMFDARVG